MTARFTVLASGSTGNAYLLQAGGSGVLIDFGVGPRRLARRLAACGLSWRNIHASVLTHTHSDHWHEGALCQLAELGVSLFCHPAHRDYLTIASPTFAEMVASDKVHVYEPATDFGVVPGISCRPIAVCHDCGPTFGFRFEGQDGLYGPGWAVGFAADLGCWDDCLAQALTDVDLLAVEFNHDVEMQRRSGRPDSLISRVLSDEGHLSNEQGAGLLRAAVAASTHSCLRHVVPLHLSRQCNRPALARAAAEGAVRAAKATARVHLHANGRGGPSLLIGVTAGQRQRVARRSTSRPDDPGFWTDDLADVG